jgi:hypothetical protein
MEHLRPVYGFPITRYNKTGHTDHHQALRNKNEKSFKKEEKILNDNNDLSTLVSENDEISNKSLKNKSRTKIDFRFSEEVDPEWRMPRDNSNKISWVKPLMSSSYSTTSSSFNVVQLSTTFFILTFCRFAQYLYYY